MRATRVVLLVLATLAAPAVPARRAPAADPTVADALRLAPIQGDVTYDRPTAEEAARCRIQPETIGGKRGWVVQRRQDR
jgi:hypothetical protein